MIPKTKINIQDNNNNLNQTMPKKIKNWWI